MMCSGCPQRVLRDDVFGVYLACVTFRCVPGALSVYYVPICSGCPQRVLRDDVFGVFSACVT